MAHCLRQVDIRHIDCVCINDATPNHENAFLPRKPFENIDKSLIAVILQSKKSNDCAVEKGERVSRTDDPATAGTTRVTSYHVARRAGVSQSAVSRAFRDGASISAELRSRIHRAASELGYAPSNIARALITQRSRLVGVVVTRITARNNPDILFHLGQHIQDSGSRMLVFTLPDDSAGDTILADLLAYHVDGFIAAATMSDQTLHACAKRNLPVILYNRHSAGAPAASLACDHATGMRDLARHLAETGTRDAAFIAGPFGAPVSDERHRAARAGFAEFGMHLRPPIHADYTHDGGHAATIQLISTTPRPDTIVCANDTMALGAIDACRHVLGLAVPDDIAITGFDDNTQAGWPSYGLTTVAQPLEDLGRAAVQMLMDHIEGRVVQSERRLIPARLVIRTSTRG